MLRLSWGCDNKVTVSDIKLNQPKVPPGGAPPTTTPAPVPEVKVNGADSSALPPIDQTNGVPNGVSQAVKDVDAMKTPGGGIKAQKKTKQQRREALFKKKRARSALSHKVQSIDMGLYPVDTDSSDEDLFTGNVWWEGATEDGGHENGGFVPDNSAAPPAPEPTPAAEPTPAPEPAPAEEEKPVE